MNLYDEMVPTNINTPAPPDEPRAAPITVPRPQQSISAVDVVQPSTTQTIATTPPVQEAAAPRVAGGNLVLQGTDGRPAPAVQMQQSQSAPQVLSPISTLKTGT
jgi:hypothetical protein